MNRNAEARNKRRQGSDLIGRAQQGDGDAFASIFHTHRNRIYSLCLRMTHNIAEAEELTQDVFLQVFRKLPTFRGDSALSTWLYRVTMNTVLMNTRRKPPSQVSLDEPNFENEDGAPGARDYEYRDHHLEISVTRLELIRAIRELSEEHRMILVLHDFEGYPHHEIAASLGCSVGVCKSQLYRARLRIRESLADPGRVRKTHSSMTRSKFLLRNPSREMKAA